MGVECSAPWPDESLGTARAYHEHARMCPRFLPRGNDMRCMQYRIGRLLCGRSRGPTALAMTM
eukprot:9472885-Pyramimonas_sp.AAC.2